MEKVEYVVNMIKDMDIKDKLRLAINMNQSSFLSIQYDKKKCINTLIKNLEKLTKNIEQH